LSAHFSVERGGRYGQNVQDWERVSSSAEHRHISCLVYSADVAMLTALNFTRATGSRAQKGSVNKTDELFLCSSQAKRQFMALPDNAAHKPQLPSLGQSSGGPRTMY
jgi:hypothetical protein